MFNNIGKYYNSIIDIGNGIRCFCIKKTCLDHQYANIITNTRISICVRITLVVGYAGLTYIF